MNVWNRAALVLAALVLAAGCGKKDDDTGGGDGPSGGGPSSDIPAPPRASGPLTLGWGRLELADARKTTSNNLKHIAIAFHNAHDVNQYFPVGITDASGKKLGLSWRVAILPHIEQGALYKQFKLDEPWDSDHNKTLIRKMPAIYAAPGSTASRGYTYYRGFGGSGALAFMPSQGKGGTLARGPRFPDFTDGMSNTILVAELAEPTIWTRPDDPVVGFDPFNPQAPKDGPLPKFGGVYETGFFVALCDGSNRFVKQPVNEADLRGMITRNGGEVVNLP